MKYRPKTQKASWTCYFDQLVQILLLTQIATTALYFNGFFTNPLVHKVLLGFNLSLFAWLAFGIACFTRGSIRLAWSPFYLPAVVLLVWSAIRAVTTPLPEAPTYFYLFAVILLAFPLWVTYFQYDPRFRTRFAWTVFGIGVIFVLGAFRVILSDNPALNIPGFKAVTLSSGSYERQRLGLFLGHNKPAAAYLWISALYAGYLWYRYRKNWLALAFPAFIIVVLGLLVVSGSRGEALMVPVGLVILAIGFYTHRNRGRVKDQFNSILQNKTLVYGALFALTVGLVLMVYVSSRALQSEKGESVFARFGTSVDVLTSGTYPRVWWLSMQMAYYNPVLGVGFASWPYFYPEYQGQWFNEYPQTQIGLPKLGQFTERAHNDFLQTWAELGLPGLICIVWLLVIYLKTLWLLFRHQKLLPLGLFAGAAVAGTLVRATVGFPFHETAASCLFLANLAMLSQQVYPKQQEWHLKFLQINPNAKWSALALLPVVFIMNQPIVGYVVGDYFEQYYIRWDTEAARTTDPQMRETYYGYSYDFLQEALKFTPEMSNRTVSFANKVIHKAIRENDMNLLKSGIDYLEQGMQGRQFYMNHSELGVAYQFLWEHSNNPVHYENAVEHMKKAIYIMPTYLDGYLDLALLQSRGGHAEEAYELMRMATIKYKNFVDAVVIPRAHSAEQLNDIEEANLIFSLATTVDAGNPEVFREAILFYYRIDRMDMVKIQFMSMAPYQPLEVVDPIMVNILLYYLDKNESLEAYALLREMAEYEQFKTFAPLWYYTGILALICGQPDAALMAWSYMHQHGIELQAIEPALTKTINFYAPFVFIR